MSTAARTALGQAAEEQERLEPRVGPGEDVPEHGSVVDLSGYDPQGYNILSPVLRMDTAAPYLRLRAVEVRLDPDPRRGDCYIAPGTRWTKDARTGRSVPEMLAPSKPGLLKIASAAGLILDPHNSRRIKPDACERCIDMAHATGNGVRCGDCPSRFDVAYQHVGAVRTDSGWRIVKASYEWNLDAQRRKITREAKKREAKAQQDGKPATRMAGKPFDLDAYVEDRLDQVTAERFGLAETKSLLRLVRAICHVRQAYRREEMALPFVVVRTELAPDYSDPAVRHVLTQRALTSGTDIFGPSAADTPAATLREAGVEAQVVEQLAAEPDFTDAESTAEDVAVVDDSDAGNGSGDLALLADEDDKLEPAAAEAEHHPTDEQPDAVCCDDCGATLPANVVAYCQGPRGREAFGGGNYCYACQKTHRGGTGEAGAR